MTILLVECFLRSTGGQMVLLKRFMGATGAPFLLLECLLRSTGAQIALPKRLSAATAVTIVYSITESRFGTTDTNVITGAAF